MARERLYLFDTTLRDGAQTNGVDFTLADKLTISAMLDDLGIDYIEGGYPGANPTDTELFSTDRKLGHATFTAFGMTRRPGRSTSNDPGLAALLDANAKAICFVAKSWDFHVRVALETTEEENLASIRDSVAAAKAKGREVLLDCEHFFDGYKANPQYALACAKAAYDCRRALGGAVRHQWRHAARMRSRRSSRRSARSSPAIMSAFMPTTTPSRRWRIRLPPCAPARGRSRAPSMAWASAAATPTWSRSSRRLKLKGEFAEQFDIGVSDDALAKLPLVSHKLDDMLNRAPNRYAPYVGESAFATKAGIHASAIMKDSGTYEHVAPESVGNKRKLLVSEQSGKSNVLAELERIGIKIGKDDPRVGAGA